MGYNRQNARGSGRGHGLDRLYEMRASIISCVIIILFFAVGVSAHGVDGEAVHGCGIIVTAEYDTGEPMSYAKVEIYAPNSKLKFQGGRTDRNGRFCFIPDTKGNWKAVVNDGIGHRLELAILVNNHMETVSSRHNNNKLVPGSLSRYEKALIGLSIIFGVSGIFFWWRGRRH